VNIKTTPQRTRAKSTVASSPGKKARVVLVGSGRMGHIRASILVSSPRFDFIGIVDKDLDSGRALGEKYGVST
jgi:predicted dehydrogenase